MGKMNNNNNYYYCLWCIARSSSSNSDIMTRECHTTFVEIRLGWTGEWVVGAWEWGLIYCKNCGYLCHWFTLLVNQFRASVVIYWLTETALFCMINQWPHLSGNFREWLSLVKYETAAMNKGSTANLLSYFIVSFLQVLFIADEVQSGLGRTGR